MEADANDNPRTTKSRGKQLATVSSRSKNPAGNNFTSPGPGPGHDNYNTKDKSMSIQDVKESKAGAGSHYSLRSQLKLPISSSESDQSKEPLTKKPAKGSKQSSTVKLAQKSEIPMKPRDERPTSEIALNVDLVVKSLFRYMNCTTLKSCRLVCRRWKYFGAKELQRRRNVTIQLSFSYGTKGIDKVKNSLRSLLAVIQNSDPNTFPCASCDISTVELSTPQINKFFSLAEARNPIKKMSLTLKYRKKKLSWEKSTSPEDLRDLFQQVPNLEVLLINCLPSHWADGLNPLDSGFCRVENSPYLLLKLKSLNLTGWSIPLELFEDLMDAAVNLQSCAGYHFSPEQLRYFVDGNGRHRIHVLKHLRFLLDGSFVDVMEQLVSLHGVNLKLESFYFRDPFTRLNGGAELWSRASSIINQLFLSSASSMRTMGIMFMRFLPGLEIPQLPNLRTILLVGNIAEDDTDNDFFFPFGFSVAKNFPNLSTVGFPLGSTLKSLEMLSITEPVTSVKHILIKDKHEIDDGTRVRLYAAFPSVVLIEEEM